MENVEFLAHPARTLEMHASPYPVAHPARRTEYLQWLHLSNPFGNGIVTLVVGDDQSLLAAMGAVPFRIGVGRESLIAYSVVNVLVHPLHRTKNLFVKMIRVLFASLRERGAWLVGHPNDAAFPGWKRAKMCFKAGADLAV